MVRWFLFVSLFVSSLATAQSKRPLVVNIDNPNFRKLILAIPAFNIDKSDGKMAQMAYKGAEELGRLLTFSGMFNIISEKAYGDVVRQMRKSKGGSAAFGSLDKGTGGIDIGQWKAVGVESLTLGELGSDSDGYTLSIRTVDINRNEMVLGKKYSKIKSNDFNLVIRRYADLLLQAYTGKPGIFSSKIVFIGRRTKNSSKQVYICDFDGTNVIQITKGKEPKVSPSWSRDGRFITFTSYEAGNPDLYLHELATGRRRKISSYSGLNSGSNWGPNDKLIAYTGTVAGNADIYYISSQGGKRNPLIRGSGLDVDPAFSPDGQHMAFVSGRYGNPHIFRASLSWNADGTQVKVTGDKRLTYAGWYNATPSWSPSGDKLAFAGYDRDIDRFDLFMMDPDGKTLERLTLRTGDNESPDWAPNGQMLVFQSNRLNGKNIKSVPQLFIMNRDGSSQREISTGLYEAQTPKWSGPLE